MKRFLVFIFLFSLTALLYSQQNEYYFKFKINEQSDLYTLAHTVSIDNVNGNDVYAYANDNEMKDFIKLGIFYEMLPSPGSLINPKMSDNPDEILDWDTYPTYDGYVTLMNQFASSYPNLCRIVNAGSTVQGRAILFAVISDNVNTHEAEPQFMYTSSMHGDETTGYILMLHLIDYLLTNYGAIPKVTNMVDNMEIWINPLANPDGTYHGGNGTVNGAWRYNANGVDLNRNFPPTDNWNSGTPQIEMQNMCNLAIANHFVMSCNFHGGAEVVNYPWDTWSRLNADNSWWIYVSRMYADTVHANAVSGYLTDLNNGITNGYAWYYVGGGRQDYHNYFRRDREFTIELSHTKLLPTSQLINHWNYNYKSLLNYMQEALYGITGTVTDSVTGLPVKARVFAVGHDIDSTNVYSDSLFGKYYRPIFTGTYTLNFSAPGYYDKNVTGIYVKNDSTTIRNVQLSPLVSGISQNGNNIPTEYNLYQNYPNPFNPSTKIRFDVPPDSRLRGNDNIVLKIYDALGREITSLIPPLWGGQAGLAPGSYEVEWDGFNYPSGVYFYKLIAGDYSDTKKMVLIK